MGAFLPVRGGGRCCSDTGDLPDGEAANSRSGESREGASSESVERSDPRSDSQVTREGRSTLAKGVDPPEIGGCRRSGETTRIPEPARGGNVGTPG
ncbi:MAG TPA: hypothetical protein DCG14_07720 [Phycisphaerales bacterium]|nr:hypothetical protein [Phycisphaerales bacterium]